MQEKGSLPKKLRILRYLMWGSLAVVLLAGAALMYLRSAVGPPLNSDDFGAVPEFRFTECRGAPFGRAEMLGKISVVDFIFTRCRSACPVMSSRMAELYRAFAGSEEVQFVSISVDPEYDTPEVLRRYAEKHGVEDRRWVFLHAPLQKVKWLAESGFHVSGDLPSMHSTKFILVDREGRIRGYYDAFDAQRLEALSLRIRRMLEARQ